MDKQTFIRLAREMRALQKEFFATSPGNRKPDLIGRAKQAEAKFDRAVEEFSQDQRGLFSEGNE